MMWEWMACLSICRPFSRLTVQKGLPHSVSGSPPQMSLTRMSRPLCWRWMRAAEFLNFGRDSVIDSDGDAVATGGGDEFCGFLDGFGAGGLFL